MEGYDALLLHILDPLMHLLILADALFSVTRTSEVFRVNSSRKVSSFVTQL